MRTQFFGCVVAILVAAIGANVDAALTGSTLVAGGLSSPVFATFAPGDSQHLFVVQLGGTIKVVDLSATTNNVLSTPFLTVPDTKAQNEGGLLGLAFDPQYNQPGTAGYGKFYTYVTVANGGVSVPGGTAQAATSPFSTHIREYSVSAGNPLVANPTATEIMSWPRPEDNHVGGWIGFSPKDGYLYIDSGDGGIGNDSGAGHFEPGGNAQNITNSPNDFMGKQLRIDVHGDDFPADPNTNYAIPPTNPFVNKTGQDEIWAYGLRNPYRASFDRDTGDLWIGDVGQDTREEIDMQPSSSTGGANYGWRLREGNIQTPGSVGGAEPANYVPPIYDYDHSGAEHGTNFSGNVVTGGYVYRGPDPSLQGQYFFADEGANRMWEMNPITKVVTNINSTVNSVHITSVSSFAEDSVGNLYFLDLGGTIYKLTTNGSLPGDYNLDGTVNAADYTVWRATLGQTVTAHSGADGDGDGMIDAGDYTIWTTNFGNTVHTSSPGSGSAVPEPAAAWLGFQSIMMSAIMYGWRRRKAT
jgi:glucose/arabinose dehydrogenase